MSRDTYHNLSPTAAKNINKIAPMMQAFFAVFALWHDVSVRVSDINTGTTIKGSITTNKVTKACDKNSSIALYAMLNHC